MSLIEFTQRKKRFSQGELRIGIGRKSFNAAAALSTITFIIIFLVAFIFVRFLGANVVEQQTGAGKGKK